MITGAIVAMAVTVLTGCGQSQVSSIVPSAPASTPSSTAAPSVAGSTSSTGTPSAGPSRSASATPSQSASPKPSASGSAKPSQGATSAESTNFTSAVAFAQAVSGHDYATAAKHASPGSAASRNLRARESLWQAEKSNGDTISTAKTTVAADPGTKSIQIGGGDEPSDRWSHFSFDSRGRVEGWNGRSGPVAKATWSKTDKALGLGLTATLTSAYASNGSLYVVIKYKASAHIGLYYGGTYAVSGHSQASARSSIVDSLAAHHTVSAYYVFKTGKLGGKITVTATAAKYTRTATLVLTVH